MYGFKCVCGFELNDHADEEAMLRVAWAHAFVCTHADSVAARSKDPNYGKPNVFFYDKR